MQHFESAAYTIKAGWAFGTAGASALGAIASTIASDVLPAGSERLLDFGFAGIFIIALIYGIRIVWLSKLDSDRKHDALEKEVRDALMSDLKEANQTRTEMIQLMRRKESRDTE